MAIINHIINFHSLRSSIPMPNPKPIPIPIPIPTPTPVPMYAHTCIDR